MPNVTIYWVSSTILVNILNIIILNVYNRLNAVIKVLPREVVVLMENYKVVTLFIAYLLY